MGKQYDLASLGINVDEAHFLTSVIVRIELFSKPQMPAEEKRWILDFLRRTTIIPLDDEVEAKTIELRRNTRLKLPDSIIAATSIVLDAILLTGDDHLLGLSYPGLETRRIF